MVEKRLRLGCKWSRFRVGCEIQKPNYLKSGQMAAILWKTIWNPDKKVRILNDPVLEWLKPDHLKTGPFEIRPLKCPDFKCLRISYGRISDPHCSDKKFETLAITLQQGSEKNSTLPRLSKIFAHYSRSHNSLSELNKYHLNFETPTKIRYWVKIHQALLSQFSLPA